MVPLGKGYYDFHFDSANDLRKIWAADTVNLKPGLLRLSQWTKDFKYLAQKQTHVSIWIRLVELPQEYWRERTLKEIASAVGTPIDIDGPTRNRTFGHYARILVDIDLSKRAYDEILVEREGFAFKVEVQYERRPLFCHHCYSIGHNVSTCRWLYSQPPEDKTNRGKQIVIAEATPTKPSRQNNDVGASTLANGSTWTWVPAPIVSTVTTAQRIPVTDTTSISLAAIPLVIPTSISQFETVTSQAGVSVYVSPLSSSSFSFPLQNVFDRISPEKLLDTVPVLDLVSPVEHVSVHSERAVQSHLTSREVLDNPTMDDVTVTLSDDVEHNRPSPREQSPKGSDERVPHKSTDEHNEVQEVSDDTVQDQTYDVVEHVDGSSGSRPVSPVVVEKTLAAIEHTSNPKEQEVVVLQQQHVHPSKNIQHGLDLWNRVHEYDARCANEDFMPVLTRKQKQKLKLQQVLPKQPSKTPARGDKHTHAQ